MPLNKALTACTPELLKILRKEFSLVLGSHDITREFELQDDRLTIRPTGTTDE